MTSCVLALEVPTAVETGASRAAGTLLAPRVMAGPCRGESGTSGSGRRTPEVRMRTVIAIKEDKSLTDVHHEGRSSEPAQSAKPWRYSKRGTTRPELSSDLGAIVSFIWFVLIVRSEAFGSKMP